MKPVQVTALSTLVIMFLFTPLNAAYLETHKNSNLEIEFVSDSEIHTLFANYDTAGVLDTRDISVNLLAFPGATGPARFATGGRGGPIYCINTLSDVAVASDGLISYREVVQAVGDVAAGPRVATFCVSGEIDNTATMLVTTGQLTVLGQTAPAPGIVLKGFRPIELDNDADDMVYRFLDVKVKDMLDAGDNTSQKNITIGGGSSSAPDRLMFDHVSLAGSTDDSFSIYVSTDTGTQVPSNATLSQSIIAEGDTTCLRNDFECGSPSDNVSQQDYAFPNHSMGPYVSSSNGDPVTGFAIVGSVIGNTVSRSPLLRSVNGGEIVNNVIFNNYGSAAAMSIAPGGYPARGFIVGNLFKHGPDTTNPENQLSISGVNDNFVVEGNQQITYPAGGAGLGVLTSVGDNGNTGNTTPNAGIARTTVDGHINLNLSCVGASVPARDSWDTRIIAELNGLSTDPVLPTAEIGIGPRVAWNTEFCGTDPGDGSKLCFYEPTTADQGQRDWSSYAGSNTHPVGYDTDNDGIPDTYEQRIIDMDGGDAIVDLTDVTHLTDSDGDGYLDWEEWANELAASCAL